MRPLILFQSSSHHLSFNGPIRRHLFAVPSILKQGSRNANARFLNSPLRLRCLQTRTYHAPNPYVYPPSRWQRHKSKILIGTVVVVCFVLNVAHYAAERQATQKNDPKLRTFLKRNFECSLSNFREGRLWTLISCSIMHHHWLHGWGNMLALISFAPTTIQVLGPARFVVVWIGAAIACSLSQLNWERNGIKHRATSRATANDERRSFGASGCVLAYFTIATFITPFAKAMIFPIPIGFPQWAVLVAITGVSGVSLWNGWAPMIGHAGHLGGIACGTLFGLRIAQRLRWWR